MPRRGLVLTSSLLLLLAGALASAPVAAQEGGAAPPSAGEKIKLVARSEKGSKVGFESSMDMQQMMNMGGMEIPTEMGLHQSWIETCQAVDDKGVATTHVQFVRVHGNFSNPMMGEFPFDSDKPSADGADDGNPMAAVGRNMTKRFEELASLAMEVRVGTDGVPQSAKALSGGEMLEQSGMSAEEMMRRMGGLGKFPAEPVGVGDSWTNESTISAGMGLKLQTKMKFTVSAIDADTVTVKQDGEVAKLPADAAASDDPQQAMLAQMMADLKLSESSLTGTAKISRKDGKLLSSESTVKFKLAGEAQGQQMEMQQTAKSKVSRLAKLPEPAKKPDAKPADKPAEKPADKPADAPAGPK